MERVLGIDRMRALAALSVVFAHLIDPYLPGVFRYVFTGHPAVIAFFVISGFCIHHPYRSSPLPVAAFLGARVTRILIPTLAAMALAQSAGLVNYNFVNGYILWSVVCELWYYALYPFFLAASRFVGWRVQWCIAMLASLAIVFALGPDPEGRGHIYGPLLNWAVGLPSWLLGCVLAHEYQAPKRARVVEWRCAVFFTAWALYWAAKHTVLGFGITLNFFALLVAFWMRAEITRGGRFRLDEVGLWSFSIYLFHMPAYVLLRKVIPLPGAWRILLVPLVLAACYLAYRLVEKPTHQLARRIYRAIARRKPPAPAAQPASEAVRASGQ